MVEMVLPLVVSGLVAQSRPLFLGIRRVAAWLMGALGLRLAVSG